MDDRRIRIKSLSLSLPIDVLIVAGLGLLTWLIITPLSAWFLGPDTATQDWVALAWTQNCWEWATEKMLAVFLLAPLFRIFEATPLWEWGLLAGAFALTLATTYELTRQISGTWLGGAAATLILIASPAFGAYAHTYFGYIFPALLLGWLMIIKKRWFWAGFSFGVAFVAHFNTLVPTGLAALAILLTHVRHEKPRAWLHAVVGGLLPLAFTELVYFAYVGTSVPGVWLRNIIRVLRRFTGDVPLVTDWLFLPEHFINLDGWPLAIIFMLGLAAPLATRDNRAGAALGLTGLFTATFFLLQAGVGGSLVLARSLMPSYPLWAINSAVVMLWVLDHIERTRVQKWAARIGLSLLAAHSILTAAFLHRFLPTAYPQVALWFEQIAEAGLPVKTQGAWSSVMFFAQKHHVEALVSDRRWLENGETDNAVLLFIDTKAPSTLDSTGYTITQYEVKSPLPDRYPALRDEITSVRYVELWWPDTDPSQSVKPDTAPDMAAAAAYYSGKECVSEPVETVDGEHIHYYELTIRRIQRWLGLRS